MTYFTKFPRIAYTLDSDASFSVVTDIIRRVSVKNEIKTNYGIYDEYDVKDEETPEILAAKVYGSSEYHWIILMMNDIIDPRYEWVLSNRALESYINSKYSNVYATHHYVSSENEDLIVDSDYTNPLTGATAMAVSNLDYETNENEKKRTIKLLKPAYLDGFVSEFEKLING